MNPIEAIFALLAEQGKAMYFGEAVTEAEHALQSAWLADRSGSPDELVIGDSHEYGDAIEPFDNPRIDDLILDYLRTFIKVPDLAIAARWHGVYVKHPTEPFVVARPTPETLAVTGIGGAGMTLSFGVAEQMISSWLGDSP